MTALETALGYLGLPKPSTIASSKSASQLSNNDMKELGWRILVDERTTAGQMTMDDLWDRPPIAAHDLIKDFAVSDPTQLTNHINMVRAEWMVARKGQAVKIADHYKLPNDVLNLANEKDPSQIDTHLLKICLHFVVAESKGKDLEWVDMTQRSARNPARQSQPYPVVDFLFDEKPDSPSQIDAKKLKEASLVSLLRLTGVKSELPSRQAVSELTVERVVGSALSGIFYSANKVHVISGQKLDAPKLLRLTTSFAYPDLAAVRTGGQGNHIEPVVIIGEGKVRERGIHDELPGRQQGKRPKQPSARAQMAASVHPTLILLVLAHYLRHRTGQDTLKLDKLPTSKVFPKFDEQAMVYGIYYDEGQVRIYIHFPQIEEDNGHYVIRFYQIPVAVFLLLEKSYLRRWRMAVALFCVQKHADMISDVLVDVINTYKV
ncbi:hypothetical protein B0H12DRAFT_449275 [Mycena haematopus]|nr:hypothetical protein B0H12DRAFT_449275 [Mycena haematopus]